MCVAQYNELLSISNRMVQNEIKRAVFKKIFCLLSMSTTEWSCYFYFYGFFLLCFKTNFELFIDIHIILLFDDAFLNTLLAFWYAN